MKKIVLSLILSGISSVAFSTEDSLKDLKDSEQQRFLSAECDLSKTGEKEPCKAIAYGCWYGIKITDPAHGYWYGIKPTDPIDFKVKYNGPKERNTLEYLLGLCPPGDVAIEQRSDGLEDHNEIIAKGEWQYTP